MSFRKMILRSSSNCSFMNWGWLLCQFIFYANLWVGKIDIFLEIHFLVIIYISLAIDWIDFFGHQEICFNLTDEKSFHEIHQTIDFFDVFIEWNGWSALTQCNVCTFISFLFTVLHEYFVRCLKYLKFRNDHDVVWLHCWQ